MLSIVVSVVLFFLSLLIFFSVRSSDKKSRSLANVNAQIKSFRSEVSATTQRLLTTAQDCTDNVQTHVDKARNTVDIVNTCLDRLSQHQKDLTQLEGVCVDYRRALDKLKVQTEQAEGRIAVVQQEVRKAESVSEFVKSFHEEAELLVNQMQDLKAEYVRLVTSTQESLKQQAALQKSENTDMLSQFSSAVERQKAQFVEFINVEKQGFTRECDEQTRIAEDVTTKIKEYRGEVDTAIKNASASCQALKDDMRSFIESERKSIENLRGEVTQSLDDMKGAVDAEKGDLDAKIKECTDRLNSAVDLMLESLNKKKGSIDDFVEEKYQDLDRRVNSREAEFKESILTMSKDVDDRLLSLSKEKDAYTEKARIGYKAALAAELESLSSSFEKIKASVAEQIESLAERSKDTRETVAMLTAGESDKLTETVTRLKELSEKIALSEANLTAIQEQVTEAKEELYKSQQEHGKLVGQINEVQKDIEKAQGELSEAKEKRMKEEAQAVRIRLEMDRSKDKEEKKSRAETIIEQFPEDIFIGDEEEIDLSDEDE